MPKAYTESAMDGETDLVNICLQSLMNALFSVLVENELHFGTPPLVLFNFIMF